MKKYILFFLLLASFSLSFAQSEPSFLCTYKGGYFIRNGSTWYEYRPELKDGIWSTYSQNGTDDNYYYIKNKMCEICIPFKSHNNIWIKEANSEWKKVYETITVYNYCPEHSTQVFTYQDGFFIKNGNTWNFYIPTKENKRIWSVYTQYNSDDNYYYIKNSTDNLAIPRKSKNDFFWYKNDKWEKLYTTLALYDPQSPDAKSGHNNVSNNSSSNTSVQDNINKSSNSRSASSQYAFDEVFYFKDNKNVRVQIESSGNSYITCREGTSVIYSFYNAKLYNDFIYYGTDMLEFKIQKDNYPTAYLKCKDGFSFFSINMMDGRGDIYIFSTDDASKTRENKEKFLYLKSLIKK